MENKFDATKLNGLSDLLLCKGEIGETLTEIIKKVAPSGKVAFVTTEKNHDEYGKLITSTLAKVNSKTVSIIMPTPVNNTVEYFGALFNLPDDVRAVVVTEGALFRAASYFANVKELPLIFVPVSANLSGTLEKEFFVRNGKTLDLVKGAETMYVVIDESLLSGKIADAYAFNMAKLTTLIDYRAVRGKSADARAYFIAMEGVQGSYTVTKEPIKNRPLCLLYNGLKIAIGGRIDSFINKSSVFAAACLLTGGASPLPKHELFCALKLLELFNESFKIKGMAEVMPDYISRAEKVAETLNVDERQTAEELLKQRTTLKNSIRFIPILNSLKEETCELVSHSKSITGTYFSLSGDKKPIVTATALKYSGDTPIGLNTMSVLRELGITDTPLIKA
ncbi:MAG: hypothetical protein SPL13_06100 [Clostridia bacterium]|nr:hypothetical protein [Clostridia bacterium]